MQTDDEELFLNPWEDVYSPAIYLITIEEISTPEINQNPKLTPAKIVNKLVKVKALNEEQQTEVLLILKKFGNIFTTGLDQL
ncbi:3044_t:CDS:1, partial [Racocetra persica]